MNVINSHEEFGADGNYSYGIKFLMITFCVVK